MMTPLVQRHDPRAVSLATAPCQSSTRRRAARTRSPPPCSLDGMARADPAARPGRGYEQGQPAALPEQDGEEPANRDARQSGTRVTGQNGRGSAKRAVLRTARSAPTLYTICTHPLLRIDP